MTTIDWVPGDMLGLKIPPHATALRAGGEAYLTAAFRASGALEPDNRVAEILHWEERLIGGTGRKLILSVAYARTLCLAAGFSLLVAASAKADLIGATYHFNVTTTGNTQAGEFTPGTYTANANPGFCIGPPVNCSGGQGLSGGFSFADQSPTQGTITFEFFGSSFHSGGSFSVDLGDFSLPDGDTIASVSYVSGNLVQNSFAAGTFSGVTWDGTDAVFTFTDPVDYESYAGNGTPIVFAVSQQPAEVPAPGGFGVLAAALAGLTGLRFFDHFRRRRTSRA